MIEVRLLGPMQVLVGGVSLPLGAPKQQTVLAMLATRPGRIVTLEELIDELWPDAAPASAVANSRSYAARLRRVFDQADATKGLLARCGPGYEFRARPDDIDLLAFEVEYQQATEALHTGDLPEADDLFRQAESRWRGPMLPGVPLGPVLSARRTTVLAQRLGLVEQRAELHLAAGNPHRAIPMLREHLRVHPLREHGHALLIRALYEDGDVPGALAAFATARSELVDQLGIEPGDELQQLHRAVLDRDPALKRPQTTARQSEPSPPIVPDGPAVASADSSDSQMVRPSCWLPRDIVSFTGRTETVHRLVEAVERAESTVPVIRVIDGMAGIGKTALAVHLARRFIWRYPDAQLFIDLQGHSSASPVDPATALVTLLRQLGVPAGRIPAELEHRVALWRSELATRRVIVLLDNAGSRRQLEPLLPSAAGALVLVTSRQRLLASDGIAPESLPVLGEEEAVELLATVVGQDRVHAEAEAAVSVVRRCGYLPLALRLAGARLVHRPGWRVADLAQRLDRDMTILGELSAEDQSIASAFALSYEPLRQSVQRMFRLIGLFPGESFQSTVAAALSGLSLADAESSLAELVDHHLVEEPTAGRFRLHDLLRQYAHRLAITTELATQRQQAVEQILDHYLHIVAVVSEMLALPHHRASVPLGKPMRPDLLSAAAPDTKMMESERGNIRALIRLAVEGGYDDFGWWLPRLTWRFHYVSGFSDEIIETHRLGLRAARRIRDVVATARMHNYMASGYLNLSDYPTAVHHLRASIDLCRSAGDTVGERASWANLAVVLIRMGLIRESVEIFQRVWREGMPGLGTNLGTSLMLLGRYEDALHVQRITLFAAIEFKKSFAVAQDLGNIGKIRLRMGHAVQAARLIKTSLALRARVGHRNGEAGAINDLGSAYRQLGRLDEAQQLHRRAIAAAADAGERDVESAALNDLGLTLSASGHEPNAFEVHQQALGLATRISHPYEQGRALAAIAAHLEPHDPAEARRHWERALAIFRRMGVPERSETERYLARLPLPVEL